MKTENIHTKSSKFMLLHMALVFLGLFSIDVILSNPQCVLPGDIQ